MATKVGPKGQVVIPKAVRERVGLQPGDVVDVTDDGQTIAVRPVRAHTLRGSLANTDVLEAYETEKAAEREREHRRDPRPAIPSCSGSLSGRRST